MENDIENDIAVLVVDNGTDFCKAGFAGDDAPRAVLPSIVGTPSVRLEYQSGGHRAIERRSMLRLRYPIQRGIITDWNCMEEVSILLSNSFVCMHASVWRTFLPSAPPSPPFSTEPFDIKGYF